MSSYAEEIKLVEKNQKKENLEEEIAEVKKLESFRKEKARETQKKEHMFASLSLTAGIIIIFVCFVMFLINVSVVKIDVLLFSSLIGMGIGFLFVLFSIIGIVKRNKEFLKGQKLKVVSEEEYYYLKNGYKKQNFITYVDSETVLNSNLKKVEERKFVSPLADLEDEEEAAGTAVTHIVRNYDFFEFTSKNILERFLDESKFNGIELKEKDGRNLLSHISYSRLLLLKNMKLPLYRLPISNSLAMTFSSKSFFVNCSEMTSEEDLVKNEDFNNAFENAKADLDSFTFLVLSGVKSSELSNLLVDFKDSIFDKNNKHKVRTKFSDKNYEMVPNLYFVVFLDDDGLECSSDFLKYSSLIEVSPSIYTGEKPLLEVKKIQISDFKHVMDLVKSDYSLEETNWRKLDGLEAFVSSIKPYHIDNDIVNNIENHVAYQMSLGTEEDTIIDEILSCDLLPCILKILSKEEVYKEDGLEKYLSDNFETDFALPGVDHLLKDFSSHSSKKVELLNEILADENQKPVEEKEEPSSEVQENNPVSDVTDLEEKDDSQKKEGE